MFVLFCGFVFLRPRLAVRVLVLLLLLEFFLAAFEFFAPMTVDNNEIKLVRGEVERVQK